MKTLFLSDGPMGQIVLTPENDFERQLLKQWQNQTKTARVMVGSYYECEGGWTRESSSDSSLIIRLEEDK